MFMRIAFLTDLHLGTPGQSTQGVDVRRNFLNALNYLNELKPDALVVGGDVCYDMGQAQTYRWFRQRVESLPYPWFAIAGNHDTSPLMARELGLEAHLRDEEFFFEEKLGETSALFLDTGRGTCSEAQWGWLGEKLAGRDEALVFMHHPPLLAGVGHMDTNYPFRDSSTFLELTAPLRRVTVVCGHYHVEKVVQRGNLTVYLTPSLFFQMKHDPMECVFDHFRIGIRELNLLPGGNLTTAVHYLSGIRTQEVQA